MTHSMCRRLQVTPDDRSALAFPFAHLGGINWLMAALMSGCRIILIETFNEPTPSPRLPGGRDPRRCHDGVSPGVSRGAAR